MYGGLSVRLDEMVENGTLRLYQVVRLVNFFRAPTMNTHVVMIHDLEIITNALGPIGSATSIHRRRRSI
jgi:hypothetical protein